MRRHEHNQPEDRQPGRGEYLEKGDSETAVIVNMQCTDPRHRQVLSRYARWHVVARAKPDRHGQLSPAVTDRCRQEIRAAQRFLDHLVARGRTLDYCAQADLDSWLTKSRGRQMGFPRWLLDNGHLTGLALPDAVPGAGPRGQVDQDEHWALVRRMLQDSAVASVEDRAAACLVLLYAQPVSKIVALTTEDLVIGEASASAPHSLGRVRRQQLDHLRRHPHEGDRRPASEPVAG